jgi:hypothetical protein
MKIKSAASAPWMYLSGSAIYEGGGRIVPVDKTVPLRDFRQFVAQFGQYDEIIIAWLLDEWSSSSRIPGSFLMNDFHFYILVFYTLPKVNYHYSPS